MKFAADMNPDERERLLCRKCKFRPRSDSESVWCDVCIAENTLPSRTRKANNPLLTKAKKAQNDTGWYIAVFAIFVIVAMTLWGQSRPIGPESTVQGLDKKAYEELQSRGFSKREARQMARSVRRLCEQSGGSDCY